MAVSGGGHSAAAFVVAAVHKDGEGFKLEVLGARGTWIGNAQSAFEMEVLALDMATEYVSRNASALQ